MFRKREKNWPIYRIYKYLVDKDLLIDELNLVDI
jgi:hypothetical protein